MRNAVIWVSEGAPGGSWESMGGSWESLGSPLEALRAPWKAIGNPEAWIEVWLQMPVAYRQHNFPYSASNNDI